MKLTDETDCKAVLTILKKQLSFMSGWSMIRKKSPGDDGMIPDEYLVNVARVYLAQFHDNQVISIGG